MATPPDFTAGQILTAAQMNKVGLWLISTASFSGAVSHSYGSNANPVFTSDFDNYKLVFSQLLTATADGDFNFRLRADTTDLTSSSYGTQTLTSNDTTTTSGASFTTSARLGTIGSTEQTSIVFDLQSPALAKEKTGVSQNSFYLAASRVVYRGVAIFIDSAVAHNGFTILSANNISGTVSVYGYRK